MRGSVVSLLVVVLVSCSTGEVSVAALAEAAGEGNAKAAKKLIETMGSKDAEKALAAYQSVLSLGKTVEPHLRRGLDSRDAAVSEACAAVLGNLGSPDNIPYLTAAIREGGKVPYSVVWALGEIGDPEAVPALVEVLRGPNDVLRKAAVRSLIRIGTPAGEHVQALLAEPLGKTGQRAVIRVIGGIRRGEALRPLTLITGENRDAAAWALGRIGDAEALEALVGALGDARWEVRREAAEALGRLEDDRAVPALTDRLDDPEPVVREWAARSLETITGRQVLYRDEDGRMIPPYNLYR
ncbi:MAG: HEAT repeat domain-containing protein [bacterium]|nr:MAG: HEAT repeat domain-containing protein [bacterium]